MGEIQILAHSRNRGGDIFSECYTESFKEKFLRYVNELIFKMVKRTLKDTYPGGTSPTALQNEVHTFRKMYYYKETCVMVNHSVNEFYPLLLFKIYALPQDVIFPLDMSATLFNNLSPELESS